MLHLLLYLAVLSQLAGAENTPTVINIGSCPIPYFGKFYTRLYVDISGGEVAICFSPGSQQDCLVAASGGVTAVEAQVGSSAVSAGSDFHLALPQLNGSSSCAVTLSLKDDSHVLHITNELRPFDDQAAAFFQLHNSSTLSSLEVSVQVAGVELRHWNLSKEQKYFKDLSGCRHSGVVYEPNTVACDSEALSIVTCDASAGVTSSPCGPESRCHGNGRCVEDPTCTVTGPAVIDFSGQVGFVRNRCAYTLMSVPGLQLLATFRERRRKDVSFLDNVILRLESPAVDIRLGQGGQVQVDGTALSLDSSPRVSGVTLSQNGTGVSATLELSNFTCSLFFDGTTAQISMEGLPPLQGLCVNSSSSLRDVKFSEFSSSSCETQYSDPAGSGFSCTEMTERCNLLLEAPFTSCHSHIDPGPHVAACTDTLCRYPAVDGLSCQFLEAYARACGLLGNDTLEGWRSEVGCSRRHLCVDTCSTHEFCGEDVAGESRCLCRADFASKYRSKGTLGEPTLCEDDSASISLAACLLAEKGIDPSVLHLNSATCGGQMDEKSRMVTFSFNSSKPCGMVVSAKNNKIIYSNTITANSSAGLISRRDSVNVDFSCFYRQPDINNKPFRFTGGTALQQVVSESWNYSLSTTMFANAACDTLLDSSNGVDTDQMVYISLNADRLDGNIITLLIVSCWATPTTAGNDRLRYNLVDNLCENPNDSTVSVVSNGKGGAVLAFQMFQFNGRDSKIFLHFKIRLCVTNSPDCQQKCQRGRKRRSIRPKDEDENAAVFIVTWP